ncbi:hypothetical protein STAS_11416 [Striga asiatica]|uniref:Uncharacterized protein n=1 Tax=Striga asiatica TaxID=4170 RepID=A0A5A7PQW9_STRAF|nr:hypothetical protein STAS_11416 [Striga asiatica]
MGITNSKPEKSHALKLCKDRKKFIKQAIDSRFSLAAAHVSYVESLRNLGTALRKYAESEVIIETSISTSATEPDKTPSHSSYPSPSPPHLANRSPISISGSAARASYMRSGGPTAVTVRLNPGPRNLHMEESRFSMPPPPPPDECGSSWDYFDPAERSFRFEGQNGQNRDFEDERSAFGGMNGDGGELCGDDEERGTPKMETPRKKEGEKEVGKGSGVESGSRMMNRGSVEKDICAAEREDPSEYITHRAKDFVCSIRDIDNRCFRASESGKEVSRMLESSKIHVGYAEARGGSSASICMPSLGAACCQGGSMNVTDDQLVTKVITWKRTSSKSSSSKNLLATRDDNSDSGSDFVEEFCMISGSHSSTLDRLYAWERKLYDEVKASESIQKEYNRKCDQLRHQFAKDMSSQIIDKTRAAVKDLHSRMRVALHSVDTISKRIEKMRDEEMLPQLLELIHGIYSQEPMFDCNIKLQMAQKLTRMWKAMLECHHSQYITISLAYHARGSAVAPPGETQRQIILQLMDEVEFFGLSFTDWVNSYTSYVGSLNSWLQNSILQPPPGDRHKGRRAAFSPRRHLAPPIFVLCRDWSAGIKSLPSQEVSDSVKGFLAELRRSVRHQAEESKKMDESLTELKHDDEGGSNVGSIQGSLTKVLDRLTKFSEGSVKVCEDILQKYICWGENMEFLGQVSFVEDDWLIADESRALA